MVKRLKAHAKRSEWRALVRAAKSRGKTNSEAIAWAMNKLNAKYNRPAYYHQTRWVKPAGFDLEWWNGKLLRVRKSVRPTKQEARRARERQEKFHAMVVAAQLHNHLLLQRISRDRKRIERRLRFDEETLPKCVFDPKAQVSFHLLPNEEERIMHEKFIQVTNLAKEELGCEMVYDSDGLGGNNVAGGEMTTELTRALSQAWDLPRESGESSGSPCNV